MRIEKYKQILLEKYGRKCFYCDEDLKGFGYTIDHFIPQSKGGKWKLNNLRISCLRCNNIKDNLSIRNFIKKVDRLILTQQNEEEFTGYLEYLKRIKTKWTT